MKAQLSLPNGLFDLMDDLAQAGEDVDVVAEEALQAAAETALDFMRPKIHVDEGDLLASFTIGNIERDGNVAFILIGQGNDKRTSKRDAIKANVFEYGSSNMAADPIVRPVMEGKKSNILKAMRDVIEDRGMA
jgi:HK97 gp10 family phage protein